MRTLLLLLMVAQLGCPGRHPPQSARSAKTVLPFAIRELNIELVAAPARESITMRVRMVLDNRALKKRVTFLWTRPAAVKGIYLLRGGSRTPVSYAFKANPAASWRSELTLQLNHPRPVMQLLFEYRYDAKSFTGWAMNPATMDRLYLGQLTAQSIYASHLLYYPQHRPQENAFAEGAKLTVTCPAGWTAVSSGRLQKVSSDGVGRARRFVYTMPFSSGRLPYPLAIYPYQKTKGRADGGLPITIYHAPKDATFAREKLALIKTRILPFLQKLMGPFPFAQLRIVEVFPQQGNTGLAAKSLVMLSERRWFAVGLDAKLSSLAATVLVDEIAHQWNYYKIKLPNFLAEGVSEFTDMLFVEHLRGRQVYEEKLTKYIAAYGRIVRLIKVLKTFKVQKKMTLPQAAAALKLKPAVIKAFWARAELGEAPIASPKTFPALYFIKGALALHALRKTLGDKLFFSGFRALFTKEQPAGMPGRATLTLADFRRAFEGAAKRPLSAFFDRWYKRPGMPMTAP